MENSMIEEFILEELWSILKDKTIQLKGQDTFKQNFIDDLRTEVIDLDNEGRNANNSIDELRQIFNGLDLMTKWYEWHTSTGEGVNFNQQDKAQDSFQSDEKIFLQKFEEFNYEGLLTIQGPIDDKFDIFEKPDLFYIQDQQANYLCFGGEKHAQIHHYYQNHLQDQNIAEFLIVTQVKLLESLKNNTVQTNFMFYLESDELKVLILEQMNDGKDFLQVYFLKPKSRLPELTVEIQGLRQWSYYVNKAREKVTVLQANDFTAKLNEIYDKSKLQNVDVCEWVSVGQKKQVFSCQVNQFPFAVDPISQNIYNYQFKQEKQKFQWNIIETFKFPENSTDPKYQQINEFTCTEVLSRESFEFKYVAFKFLQTFQGRDPRLDDVQASINIMNQEINQVDLTKIIEIKKIYNKQIYQTVRSEFERICQKHPLLYGLDLVKHLFHGTRQSDPQTVYSFESGLDMRFSNNGAQGIGLYFADNSQYSTGYAYNNPNIIQQQQIPNNRFGQMNGARQMFLCAVITGLSSSLGGGQGARMPAAIPGKSGVLYDSFNNGIGGHFVVYDNQKSYPGYLITF
ncbi:poly adp-ribose polymerase member 14-like protein [Stylonychia lemnae]|uniref:Poly adp-ribose polymerase member 14-like protein n=1 Tax=Stylonychia lemnae TaxID=5949 RepID=A0A078AQX9_STYLE|nr:poly adp-ribose polymerase member 14-like protein [Stylonychia lemnae]|eukprot:CDW84619.1 poly adp-ribose polymerase member 14-like protein [Stylonychia lemnae]